MKMIAISITPVEPPTLKTRGAALTAAMKSTHDGGGQQFNFDPKVYGAKSVKRALSASQHRKCCYCETKFDHASYGDVEHYRPKQSARQHQGGKTLTGYFWLAYDIGNLLFSCEQCNRSYKRDLFPLMTPRKRAKSHHDDLSKEDPLIINPRNNDPINYIGFREEYPFAIDGNVYGKTTIECAGLDRETLNEARRSHLETVGLLWDIIRLNTPFTERAKKTLRKMCEPTSQFSAARLFFCSEKESSLGICLFVPTST